MVTEKIKGVAKQAGAMLEGRAGILNTLEREHGEVSALMEKVLSASSTAKGAEQHYADIRHKLLLHVRAEQDVLYTACEKRPQTAAVLGNARQEHQQIEQLLQELDTAPVDSPQWEERFRELEQTVQQHVEEEEDVLFAECESAFEDSELRDLDREYKQAKERHEQQITEVSVQRGSESGRQFPSAP